MKNKETPITYESILRNITMVFLLLVTFAFVFVASVLFAHTLGGAIGGYLQGFIIFVGGFVTGWQWSK